MHSRNRVSRNLMVLIGTMAIGGCSTDFGTAPTPKANVALSAGVVHQLVKAAHEGLEIDTAKILVRSITFRLAGNDDSVDVEGGSVVIRLVPGNPAVNVAVARITPGTYDRLRFEIRKPEDLEIPPDPDFREGSSGNQRYSVVIKGRYEDTAFVYKSRVEFEVELHLETPLTVSEDGIARITFTFDPYACFGHHGILFDPRDAVNAAAIDPSIKGAFQRAFRDDDGNGEPD